MRPEPGFARPVDFAWVTYITRGSVQEKETMAGMSSRKGWDAGSWVLYKITGRAAGMSGGLQAGRLASSSHDSGCDAKVRRWPETVLSPLWLLHSHPTRTTGGAGLPPPHLSVCACQVVPLRKDSFCLVLSLTLHARGSHCRTYIVSRTAVSKGSGN